MSNSLPELGIYKTSQSRLQLVTIFLFFFFFSDAETVIHGLTMNSLVHVELAEYLAATMRVVVVDVRGRGESGFSGPYNLETYEDDMIDLCDNHLRAKNVFFIGTSMGGGRRKKNASFVSLSFAWKG